MTSTLCRRPTRQSGYVKDADRRDVIVCECGDQILVPVRDHVLLTMSGTGHVHGQGFNLPPQPERVVKHSVNH